MPVDLDHNGAAATLTAAGVRVTGHRFEHYDDGPERLGLLVDTPIGNGFVIDRDQGHPLQIDGYANPVTALAVETGVDATRLLLALSDLSIEAWGMFHSRLAEHKDSVASALAADLDAALVGRAS